MNERIEGLWWKARIGYNNQNCDPEVLEKFAELIVAECLKLNSKELSITAIERLLPLYKEHFGVEE
jgi:hypothetical protein